MLMCASWVQEWARQENAYADIHGPQEELLTTEDLQHFRCVQLCPGHSCGQGPGYADLRAELIQLQAGGTDAVGLKVLSGTACTPSCMAAGIKQLQF